MLYICFKSECKIRGFSQILCIFFTYKKIKRIYGKDSYLGYTKWVDKILTGDEEKLKAWIKSLPENDSRGVSKSMLSKLQEKLHEVLVGKDNTNISNTLEKSEENDKISIRITPEEDADLINVTHVSHVKKI